MNAVDSIPDLIPARMLNEYAYCPRLCWIEWVEGEFVASSDTVEGLFRHRRVDQERGALPAPAEADGDGCDGDGDGSEVEADAAVGDPVVAQARAVSMSAPQLGLIARIDLVEEQGGRAAPVDVKRGAAPDVPEGAYEPERVQVCAQGLVLRENGYACDRGEIYFAQSRRRVTIPLDAARTRSRPRSTRARSARAACSLASVSLPDFLTR